MYYVSLLPIANNIRIPSAVMKLLCGARLALRFSSIIQNVHIIANLSGADSSSGVRCYMFGLIVMSKHQKIPNCVLLTSSYFCILLSFRASNISLQNNFLSSSVLVRQNESDLLWDRMYVRMQFHGSKMVTQLNSPWTFSLNLLKSVTKSTYI